MRKFLLASIFVAAPLVAANAQLLNIVAFDDGTAINLGVGCVPTAGGVLSCSGSSTDFSSIIISANGVPTLANPDLSAVTITAVRSATTGNHTLDVQVFQSGLPVTNPTPLQSSCVGGFHGRLSAPRLARQAAEGPCAEAAGPSRPGPVLRVGGRGNPCNA
jgi:hypothetical protein